MGSTMSVILLRIFYLVLILWLLRRFLASFMKPRAARPEPNSVSNNMVKDPVCSMYMDSRLALKLEKNDKTVYFCSEKCKKEYLEMEKTE